MQINRLLEMIYILLHKKSVSAGELAEQLGVSRRTIYRDIDTLSLAGIPIYTEKGRGGGVRLLSDFVLNKSILSEQEQDELLTALHGLSNIKAAEADQILQKLQATFNKTVTNWLDVDFSDWHHDHDYFNDFKTAITERRIVAFQYYNTYGDKRFRRIEPIQLRFKSKAWYLKGFCLAKQDVRLYKLSRIKDLVVTDEQFPARALILEARDSTQAQQDLQWITLKLRVQPEMAHKVYDDFTEGEIQKQPDGSFLVTATMPETHGLCSFLLSYKACIEVLEPKHVRAMIKTEAEKISKTYI
ncbi:MAG: YafY family transcriptional regulator [Oscillospiraceae bacterium]|nr:YafY family transcriptional regulator [Oscillospiraceae bacterium]